MTNNRFSWLLSFVAAILVRPLAAQQSPTPQQLINAAHRVSDLTKLGPYTLTANVTIDSADKEIRQTGLLMISRDRDRVRQELEIGGSREVRVFLGDKQYVVPGSGLLSALGLKDFDESWDPVQCSGKIASCSFKTVRRVIVGGVDAWCLSTGDDQGRSVCFDVANGVFLAEIVADQISTQFFDFIPIEDQLLHPRRSLIVKDAWRIEIDSIEIRPATAKEDLFKPPDKAIELEGCKGLKFPKPLYFPEPVFPEEESRQKKPGLVRLSVIVDKEGNVATAQALTATTEGYARQAVAAVSKWRFEPVICGGRAVNRETVVEVSFNLK